MYIRKINERLNKLLYPMHENEQDCETNKLVASYKIHFREDAINKKIQSIALPKNCNFELSEANNQTTS